MSTLSYYPPLRSLIGLEDLPPQLGFIKEGLATIFSGLYYKNLQYSANTSGSSAFYSLTICTYKRLGFNVPGTEIGIYLNPAIPSASTATDQQIALATEIPVTLRYDWPVLELVSGFSLDNFAESAASLLAMLIKVQKIDLRALVRNAIGSFATIPGDINSFINDINTKLTALLPPGVTISLPSIPDPDEQLDALIGQIEDKINLPAIEVLYSLYLFGADGIDAIKQRIEELFNNLLGGMSVMEFIESLIVPKIDASLEVTLAVEFPQSILIPLVNGEPTTDPSLKSMLSFGKADFFFGTTSGIGYTTDLQATLTPSQIGNTGLTIAVSNAKLDLSTKTTLPEVAADGRGPDFVGVYIGYAEIGFPKFWEVPEAGRPTNPNDRCKIIGKNLLIGTGGLSGSFSLVGTPSEGVLRTRFGGDGSNPNSGFSIELDQFDIRFHQGSLVDSTILGKLTVPGFSGTIDVKVTIDNQGFEVVATVPGFTFGIPNIFSFTVNTLKIGKRNGRFFIGTSGQLAILASIPGSSDPFIQQPIDIQKLVIWSNGEIELEGGSVVLPKAVTLKAGPVELSVTAVHMGSHEQLYGGQNRHYRFYGFDGGIDTGAGGVDARGEGIKYYFSVDDGPGKPAHRYLRIESIHVDITIPGDAPAEDAAVILKGYLSMKNGGASNDPNSAREYTGSVSLSLPKLDIAGGAGMRMSPDTGAFLVDIFLELSSPIPLGTTGLGIYGFRGLVGSDYVASKHAAGISDEETWFSYYRKPQIGVNVEKFEQRDGFSFGAGVSLATTADSGTAFSSKLFFLLSIPELFMLEGQAAVLSKRIGLDTTADPPFYAAIFISPSGVQAGFQATFDLPMDGAMKGDLAKINARLEMAFFRGRSNGWYINLGKDSPENERIQARILNLFDMYAYFMLSAAGIKAGAGASWSLEKKFGPAKVGLGASLDLGGRINFRPVQVGGFVKVAGYAEVSVFGLGFRIDVRAELSAEAPDPFVVSGSFELKIKTPWPLPDVNISCGLTWVIRDRVNLDEIGFISARHFGNEAEYLADPKLPAKGTHMLTGEGFPLNFYNRTFQPNTSHTSSMSSIQPPGVTGGNAWIGDFTKYALPLDTYIDIEFTKGIVPAQNDPNTTPPPLIAPITTLLGGSELVPPQKGHHSQVVHKYVVNDVQVKYWKPSTAGSLVSGTWENYEMKYLNTPLVAMVMEKALATRPAAVQVIGECARLGYWQMTDGNSYTKLRLLGRTPLEHAADNSPVDLGFPRTAIFCPPDPLPKVCQNWRFETTGRIFPGGARVTDRRLDLQISPQQGEVRPFPNIFRLEKGVMILKGSRLEIWLPTATTSVSLKLITLTNKVTISYYRGYAWAPPSSGSSGGSSDGSVTPLSWDAVPDTPTDSVVTTSLWDKLYNAPRWRRLLCLESPNIDIQSGAAASIRGLLEEFSLVNLYLRQILGLSDAIAVDEPITTLSQFCARLGETLHTLVVALTGKDDIPPVLLEYVEHFFTELGGYVDEYWKEGVDTLVANATANEFYWKWMGLIACVGRLYDALGTLPSDVRSRVTLLLDPEVDRLYHHVLELNGTAPFSMELNAATWLTTPAEQVRSFAGFFGALSLDFPKIISSDADNRLRVYFNWLNDAYFRVVGGMHAAGTRACGTPDCNRTRDLIDIVMALCSDTPNMSLSPAMQTIGDLVANAFPDIERLHRYFGWSPAAGGDYCASLREAIGMLILAYASYDDLPFALRGIVDTLHAKLQRQMTIFRDDTHEVTLPTPGSTVEAFLTTWTTIFSCLCRICQADTLSPSDRATLEALLTSDIDPEIDTIYERIIADLYQRVVSVPDPGHWTAGVDGIPEDLHGRVRMLINFFSAALTRCGTIPSQVEAVFGLYYPSTAYGNVTSYMSANSYTPCGGVSDGLCYEVIWPFEKVRALYARRDEIPVDILSYILDTLAPIVERIYRVVLNQPLPAQIVPADGKDALLWELDEVLRWFRERCFHGIQFSTPLIPLIGSDVSLLMSKISTMQSFTTWSDANFLDVGSCGWQDMLIDIYRTYCIPPPITPTSQAISLVVGFNSTLAGITQALGLETVDTTTAAISPCAAIGNIVRVLMIATGSMEVLTVEQLVAIKTFVAALQAQAAYSRVIPTPSCVDICSQWLWMLNCLCKITANPGLFPSLDITVESMISNTLAAMCGRALVIGDYLGIEFMPDRKLNSRCRKVRTIRNYFAVRGLDFASVDPTLIDFFTNRAQFQTAFESTAMQPFRDAICFPVPGPYDPLMKREEKLWSDLFHPVEYDDPNKPIDRIVIEMAPCSDVVGGNWPTDYWNLTRSMLQTELIPALTNQKNTVESQYNSANTLDPNSDQTYDLGKQLEALTGELGRATDFLATDLVGTPTATFPQCVTFLLEVCYQPPAAFSYNLRLPTFGAVRRVAQDMQKALSLMNQPLWRPDTIYAVQLELQEQVNGSAQQYTRYVTFGFRTDGPLGHFHQMGNGVVRTDYAALVAAERETEYKYSTLRGYIDYKRSYPNADGNIIDAKPLYYAHTKLRLFFIKDYISSMYSTWGWADASNPAPLKYVYSALEFVIKDPGKAVGDAEISVITTWSNDSAPKMTPPFKRFKNLARNTRVGRKNCLTIGEVEVPAKTGDVPLPPDVNLQPLKLYTAICNALLAEYATDPATDPNVHPTQDAVRHEVHRYVFQTSRYASFEEHIGSYRLSTAPAPVKSAISTIVLGSGVNVTQARDLILGQNQSTTANLQLVGAYPLIYDRLVEGILKLGGLEPPETTEFFVVRDSSSVLGILARSPEPFNDPKIPEDVLAQTIQVASLGTSTKLIFSKDRAKVFITGPSAQLTGSSVDVVFKLYEYDGSAYAQATVLAKNSSNEWVPQTVPAVTATIPLS